MDVQKFRALGCVKLAFKKSVLRKYTVHVPYLILIICLRNHWKSLVRRCGDDGGWWCVYRQSKQISKQKAKSTLSGTGDERGGQHAWVGEEKRYIVVRRESPTTSPRRRGDDRPSSQQVLASRAQPMCFPPAETTASATHVVVVIATTTSAAAITTATRTESHVPATTAASFGGHHHRRCRYSKPPLYDGAAAVTGLMTRAASTDTVTSVRELTHTHTHAD